MTDAARLDPTAHNGVLTISDRTFTSASDIIACCLRVTQLQQVRSLIIQGITLNANDSWANLVLPFTLKFEDCTFADDVNLDYSECHGLHFERCDFSHAGQGNNDGGLTAVAAVIRGDLHIRASQIGRIDAHEAVVDGHVTLEEFNEATSMNLDRMRVEGDLLIQQIRERKAIPSAGNEDSTKSVSVWGTTLRNVMARSIIIRDSRFSRGVSMYGARAESIVLERCRIGTAKQNIYEVPAFPTLGNSILGGEATLLMSSVEAQSVQVGANVWVGGDVRMLSLDARSLRVGADTNWLTRTDGVPSKESALVIHGGIFYAKDARSKRTELQIITDDGRSASMLLNDADLGDLSIYRTAVGGDNGRICLYGTIYSNIEFMEFTIASAGLRFKRHRGDIDLPGLLVLRDYAYAFRFAPVDMPQNDKPADEHAKDDKPADEHAKVHKRIRARERTRFRGQPYLAFASHLAAIGDSGGAREVLICKQDDMRKLSAMPWPSKVWNWISGFTVKYGYSIHRTVLPLILMVLIAGLVVHAGRVTDNFTATEPSLIADNALIMGEALTGPFAQEALQSSQCTRLYPCMETVSYTINMLLPFGNFAQVSLWQPSSDWAWRHLLTALIAGVWIATTVLLAALTGIARRTPES